MKSKRKTTAKKKTPPVAAAATCLDVWEYSQYRASLRRNGANFALVTRDGKNALTTEEQVMLLDALNRPNAEVSRGRTITNPESE